MIRRKCSCLSKGKREFCQEKGDRQRIEYPEPPPLQSQQLLFSDDPIVPTYTERMIGQGDSALITSSSEFEEAFLSVACVVGFPTTVSHLTAVIKRASRSLGPVYFDLIRVPSPNGEIKITGDSIVTSLALPGACALGPETVFWASHSFPPTLLDEGDLIAIRVEPPKDSRSTFYAATTLS